MWYTRGVVKSRATAQTIDLKEVHVAEQTEQVQEQNKVTVEDILAFAQENPGTPGSPVPHPETGEDSGWYFNTADEGDTTPNVPRRKGSKFLPGHDAKMYKLNRRYLAGEVEINEYQRAYMEERGMSLDRKAYQKEQKEKEQEKERKKAQAAADREAAKEQKEREKAEAKAARDAAKAEKEES